MGWRDNILVQKKKVRVEKRSSKENAIRVRHINNILRCVGIENPANTFYKEISKKGRIFLDRYHYNIAASRFIGLFLLIPYKHYY